MKQLRYNQYSLLAVGLLLISLLFSSDKPFVTEKYDSSILSLSAKSAILADGREIKLDAKYGPYSIVLVRHAEKMDESDDPELSPKGIERAERLAQIIRLYKAKMVFSTDYKRTKATVNPYILNNKVGLQTYTAAKQNNLKTMIAQRFLINTVIVGHSNSIPQLINNIAGLNLSEFASNDYANLIVIKTDLKHKGKVYFFNY